MFSTAFPHIEALAAFKRLLPHCKCREKKHLDVTRSLLQAKENNTRFTIWLLPRRIPRVSYRKMREFESQLLAVSSQLPVLCEQGYCFTRKPILFAISDPSQLRTME